MFKSIMKTIVPTIIFWVGVACASVESDVMSLFPTDNQLLYDVLQVNAQELSDGLIDTPFKQWCAWELKHHVIKKVMLPSALFVNDDDGDALLLQWFSAILLRSSNSEHAVEQWKNLLLDKKINSSRFAAKYQKYFSLEPEQIRDLYTQTQNLLSSFRQTLCPLVQEKMDEMKIHDDYNRVSGLRCLSKVIRKGVVINVLPEYIPQLELQKKVSPNALLSDRFKNKRILTMSGLNDSKVSFMIHDLFDHAWCANFLSQKENFMKRYEDFFKKVGNPFNRDLYCREGELGASIAFEFRLYLASHDYEPLYDVSDILDILEASNAHGTMTVAQRYAYNILKNRSEQSVEFMQSLPFIFSGVVVELMEQRRQYGFIKNQEAQGVSYFDALDPEYTALIVEVCALLWENIDGVKKFLVNTALLCEDYLEAQASTKNSIALNVRIKDVEDLDVSTLSLSPEKIKWFEANPGFAATREVLSAAKKTSKDQKEVCMNIEFEAKFFAEPESFKKLLIQQGATLVKQETLMRRKTFFLPGVDAASQKNMWGRVRDEGNRITMTIKRMSSGNSIDGVQEIELNVDDFNRACLFMQIAGCTEKSYQENYRETWEFNNCQITIDRWPGLQPFIEVEGPDEQTVLNVLQQLHVNPDSIFFGSIDLVYQQYLGIPSATFNLLPNVTFDSIDELIKKHATLKL